ncbi:hypothetical protein X801_01936 [Opisthorchis viverrini]|uniref:Fibronectin type-III domain-containing protein n=1 Tax=Opisthorchis viverrini TaxID=6198 RepID=A0A1S8X670_OPIVI|nr:hypothetical protein X801_01936 [Opisthorchis viverrini]
MSKLAHYAPGTPRTPLLAVWNVSGLHVNWKNSLRPEYQITKVYLTLTDASNTVMYAMDASEDEVTLPPTNMKCNPHLFFFAENAAGTSQISAPSISWELPTQPSQFAVDPLTHNIGHRVHWSDIRLETKFPSACEVTYRLTRIHLKNANRRENVYLTKKLEMSFTDLQPGSTYVYKLQTKFAGLEVETESIPEIEVHTPEAVYTPINPMLTKTADNTWSIDWSGQLEAHKGNARVHVVLTKGEKLQWFSISASRLRHSFPICSWNEDPYVFYAIENAAGTSPYIFVRDEADFVKNKPATPATITLKNLPDHLGHSLSWTGPSNDPACPGRYIYKVERTDWATPAVKKVYRTSWGRSTFLDVEPGKTYGYRVSAIDDDLQTGEFSSWMNVTTPQLPTTPSVPVVTKNGTDVVINWEEHTKADEHLQKIHLAFVHPTGHLDIKEFSRIITSFTLPISPSDIGIRLYFATETNAGQSGFVHIPVEQHFFPAPPQGLSVELDEHVLSHHITWDCSWNSVSVAVDYRVKQWAKLDDDKVVIARFDTRDNHFVYPNVLPGVQYMYKVKIIVNGVASNYTNPVEAFVVHKPSFDTLPHVTCRGNLLSIRWNKAKLSMVPTISKVYILVTDNKWREFKTIPFEQGMFEMRTNWCYSRRMKIFFGLSNAAGHSRYLKLRVPVS